MYMCVCMYMRVNEHTTERKTERFGKGSGFFPFFFPPPPPPFDAKVLSRTRKHTITLPLHTHTFHLSIHTHTHSTPTHTSSHMCSHSKRALHPLTLTPTQPPTHSRALPNSSHSLPSHPIPSPPTTTTTTEHTHVNTHAHTYTHTVSH